MTTTKAPPPPFPPMSSLTTSYLPPPFITMPTDPHVPPPGALSVHFASNPDPVDEDVTVRILFD
jgi:hypothetical protein